MTARRLALSVVLCGFALTPSASASARSLTDFTTAGGTVFGDASGLIAQPLGSSVIAVLADDGTVSRHVPLPADCQGLTGVATGRLFVQCIGAQGAFTASTIDAVTGAVQAVPGTAQISALVCAAGCGAAITEVGSQWLKIGLDNPRVGVDFSYLNWRSGVARSVEAGSIVDLDAPSLVIRRCRHHPGWRVGADTAFRVRGGIARLLNGRVRLQRCSTGRTQTLATGVRELRRPSFDTLTWTRPGRITLARMGAGRPATKTWTSPRLVLDAVERVALSSTRIFVSLQTGAASEHILVGRRRQVAPARVGPSTRLASTPLPTPARARPAPPPAPGWPTGTGRGRSRS